MTLEEFRNLDLAEIGTWPRPAKWLVWVMLVMLLWFIGYRMVIAPTWERLEEARSQESQLKQDFQQKQSMAAGQEAYRDQMHGLQQAFGSMLGPLPGESEVAGLLEDISRTGRENGLEFQFFKPEQEVDKEFYLELPIRIRVAGSYHQFGRFISDLAALPRIVTVHEVQIGHGGEPGGKLLHMELLAKTYRYTNRTDAGDGVAGKGEQP